MGFLANLFAGPALTALTNALLGPLENIFKAYIGKEISRDQLAEKLQEAILAAFADVEKTFLDSLTKTYTAFIGGVAQNPVMARAWSIVLYSQLAVLIWHQMAVPALATYGIKYASSGATVDWAYALIALCLGAPAIAARVGPGMTAAADAIKSVMAGKK